MLLYMILSYVVINKLILDSISRYQGRVCRYCETLKLSQQLLNLMTGSAREACIMDYGGLNISELFFCDVVSGVGVLMSVVQREIVGMQLYSV